MVEKLRLDYTLVGKQEIDPQILDSHVHMIFTKDNERVCFQLNDKTGQYELRYEVPKVVGKIDVPDEGV